MSTPSTVCLFNSVVQIEYFSDFKIHTTVLSDIQ